MRVPFPTIPVSNGEWLPLPVTRHQRAVSQRIADEMGRGARRHGMTRAEFLRTTAATATAFWVLNESRGLASTGDTAVLPIPTPLREDPAAGAALLDAKKFFVIDVQQHHVDLKTFGASASNFCFLRFLSTAACAADPSQLGQLNYIKEVFVDSETDIGVISGLPAGVPMGPAAMAETGRLVNQLAGARRAVWQAVCDPTFPRNAPTGIDSLEYQIKTLKARALKCYTYSGNWRLDDEQVAYPMLDRASKLGIRLINVHKGLPAMFAPGSPESVRTTDFPKVVQDWPHLKFCAYHSGYFQAGTHPAGKEGISEFLEMIATIPEKRRRNVYAEIGSTFAILIAQPDHAAHFLGQLLQALGPRNVLWGTDSIWWGSPQYLIDAFKLLTIPPAMQAQFGYPPLDDRTKARILGQNAARLYGLKGKDFARLPADRLQQVQQEQGGLRAARSLRVYGAQTRRQFFSQFGRNPLRG